MLVTNSDGNIDLGFCLRGAIPLVTISVVFKYPASDINLEKTPAFIPVNAGVFPELTAFMAAVAEIVTRTFGLEPAGIHVPSTLYERTTFDEFNAISNQFIREGMKLEPSLFMNAGHDAVKYFYDAARKLKGMSEWLGAFSFRERARRCTASSAYFPLREHVHRLRLISVIAGVLRAERDLSSLRGREFPSDRLLARIKEAARSRGVRKVYYSSKEFLSNTVRQVRNILKKMVAGRLECGDVPAGLLEVNLSPVLEAEMVRSITAELWTLLGAFLRRLSMRLTKRAKQISTGKGQKPGKGKLDALVFKIGKSESNPSRYWKKQRKLWRDATFSRLKMDLHEINIAELARKAFSGALTAGSPSRAKNWFFGVSGSWRPLDGDDIESFVAFLVAEIKSRVEFHGLSPLLPWFESMARECLGELEAFPEEQVNLPVIKAASVPFGIDDGQAYKLEATKDETTGDVTVVHLNVSFRPGETWEFELKTPGRFGKMLAAGYVPRRGTLQKHASGGLVLHVPFKRELPTPFMTGGTLLRICGVDLGLKTWMVPSFIEFDADTGKAIEFARYFIDQAQLTGRADSWFLAGKRKRHGGFNFKRRLQRLLEHAWHLQQKMKAFGNKHGKKRQRKVKYFKLRRKWKRCWLRVKNLHREIARQLASRLVSACKYHEIDILRFEDLSWAKHSKKSDVGYYLGTWQVHWFFSQIQELAAGMAARAGITVEFVDARGTSKRCSRCGYKGHRKGKAFNCPHCGFTLDSDLNAARNIAVAQTSLVATCGKGGCPSPPIN